MLALGAKSMLSSIAFCAVCLGESSSLVDVSGREAATKGRADGFSDACSSHAACVFRIGKRFYRAHRALVQPRGERHRLQHRYSDGVLVVTIFSYKPGDSEWYISSGPMSASQSTYTGLLLAVRGGQCISCAYKAPSSTINSGSIVITFTSETSATVLLPGGRMTTIRPFNFGFGTPPQGLLGQWVYVETIGGVDFADRYSFTTIGGATSEGNGVVIDFDRFASCELQVIGELAGIVVCGHWSDSTYTVALDIYAYEFGLDQTYNGAWISPMTDNAYPMKGYMSISRSGFSDAAAVAATPGDLSQRALKRQAETADRSSRISAMRSSGYSAAVAAAIEMQSRTLRNLP